MNPLIDFLQWPAMVATVLAAWFVASTNARRRHIGFWVFVLSNLLWIAWGVPSGAWARVVLQFCLFALNLRGLKKTED